MFAGNALVAVMSSFFYTDIVIHNGTQTDSGRRGVVTKNQMLKTGYYGMMGLMAPAMVTALKDVSHDSCYLLTSFMLKADLVDTVDGFGFGEQHDRLLESGLAAVEKTVAAALLSCDDDGHPDHSRLVLLVAIISMVRTQ